MTHLFVSSPLHTPSVKTCILRGGGGHFRGSRSWGKAFVDVGERGVAPSMTEGSLNQEALKVVEWREMWISRQQKEDWNYFWVLLSEDKLKYRLNERVRTSCTQLIVWARFFILELLSLCGAHPCALYQSGPFAALPPSNQFKSMWECMPAGT